MCRKMQYIYAVVKLPIEVTSDGSYNILSERISTTIEPCNELPPINEDQASGIIEQIQSIMKSSKNEERIEENAEKGVTEQEEKVKNEEIDVKLILDRPIEKSINNNMTFRNLKSIKHNITKKRIKEMS